MSELKLSVSKYGMIFTLIFMLGGGFVLALLGLRDLPLLGWGVIWAVGFIGFIRLNQVSKAFKQQQMGSGVDVGGTTSTMLLFPGLILGKLLLLQIDWVLGNFDWYATADFIWSGLIDMTLVMGGIQIALAMFLLQWQISAKGIYTTGDLSGGVAQTMGRNGPFIREMVVGAIFGMAGSVLSKMVPALIIIALGGTIL